MGGCAYVVCEERNMQKWSGERVEEGADWKWAKGRYGGEG